MTPMALGLVEPLVGEQAEQVLGVARLVAGVGEADVALPAGPGVIAGRAAAAGVAEAARRVVDDQVALLGVVVVVVVVDLRAVALAGPAGSTRNLSCCRRTRAASRSSGTGRCPSAGRVTSTSSGTPSHEGTRPARSEVGQKRTPFCAVQAWPKGVGLGGAGGRGKEKTGQRNRKRDCSVPHVHGPAPHCLTA